MPLQFLFVKHPIFGEQEQHKHDKWSNRITIMESPKKMGWSLTFRICLSSSILTIQTVCGLPCVPLSYVLCGGQSSFVFEALLTCGHDDCMLSSKDALGFPRLTMTSPVQTWLEHGASTRWMIFLAPADWPRTLLLEQHHHCWCSWTWRRSTCQGMSRAKGMAALWISFSFFWMDYGMRDVDVCLWKILCIYIYNYIYIYICTNSIAEHCLDHFNHNTFNTSLREAINNEQNRDRFGRVATFLGQKHLLISQSRCKRSILSLYDWATSQKFNMVWICQD